MIISYFILIITLLGCNNPANQNRINRKEVVSRHNIVSNKFSEQSPAQVRNGEIAFGVDLTGLQTFIPFNTLSQWGWHSDPVTVTVESPLIDLKRLAVKITFPAASAHNSRKGNHIGICDEPDRHATTYKEIKQQVIFTRELDQEKYHSALSWDTPYIFSKSKNNPQAFKLIPKETRWRSPVSSPQNRFRKNLSQQQKDFRIARKDGNIFWNRGLLSISPKAKINDGLYWRDASYCPAI